MSASQEMSEESKELKRLLLMKETDCFITKSHICTICVDLSQPIKWHHTSGSLISDRIPLIKRESQKHSQYNVPVQCEAFPSSNNIMGSIQTHQRQKSQTFVFSLQFQWFFFLLLVVF